MQAIVLDQPGPVEALAIRTLPIPEPQPGQVLIKVKAFGLNRAELYIRQGLGQGITWPRVLGIEATGVVAKCPGNEFSEGQQVVTMMGGMGRTIDGGYAEYTCVGVQNVIPFNSSLDWSVLGAVPEMLQTANGAMTIALDSKEGQSILIRGGTSSVGMCTALLAAQRKMTIFSTTRTPEKAPALQALGVQHVLIDDGNVAEQVRKIMPDGVDCALELVGTPTLKDTLKAAKVRGTVCYAGMLSGVWTVKDFYPFDYIPTGVRLTTYGSRAENLSPQVLQSFLDSVATGKIKVPIDGIFKMDQIAEAHALMESGKAAGKLVVLTE